MAVSALRVIRFGFRRLTSPRLSVALLLTLPGCGILGTLVPQGLGPSQYKDLYPTAWRLILAAGMGDYYRSPFYRGLLILFAANLLACSARRSLDSVRNVWASGRAFRIAGVGSGGMAPAQLVRSGFRIRSEQPLHATRRAWAFLGFPLAHLGPLAVLLGGLWGSLDGFVGTKNVYVGGSTETVYVWSEESDRRLPFTLAVEDFRLLNYPLEIEVRATAGEERAVLRTRVGRMTRVPGTPYGVRIDRFDPAEGDAPYWVETPGGRVGPFLRENMASAPVRLEFLAYRDPEVRRAEAIVALLGSDAKALARQRVAINEPLVFGGLRIFLTAWGKDAQNRPYAGFQVVRDPGQTLTWFGSAILCAGLALLLFIDGAWVREEGGALVGATSRRNGFRRLGIAASEPGSDAERGAEPAGA